MFSAYALANIDTDFSGLRVTGNVGLRVVRTDQNSTNALSGETVGINPTHPKGASANAAATTAFNESQVQWREG